MINKNNNIKKIDISINNLFRKDDLLYSNSFAEMMNNYHYNKQIEEKEQYQDDITNYIQRKQINGIKKIYDPIIVNLYNNGELIINDLKYSVKDFYIVFNNSLNNFHIKCVKDDYPNEEIDYNRLVKFIDSTAFINLIKSSDSQIIDNKIIINNIDILNKYVNSWDGYLHRETVETDAIINNKMIEDDNNE